MRLQKEANLTGYRNAWCSSALDLGDFFDFLEMDGVGNFRGNYFYIQGKRAGEQ